MSPNGRFLLQESRVLNLNYLEFLREQPSESVNCIITDPPYESLEKHRKVGTTTRLTNEWFPTIPNEAFKVIFEEFFRILKNNSHLYVFCDFETMLHFSYFGQIAGFKLWKGIIWDKVDIGMGYHYRCRHEYILFFEKGKRPLANLGIPDILQVKKNPRGYPTEKPLQLADTLISQSTIEGEIVMDPFCGSGFVGKAAKALNRRYILNDISEAAISLCKKAHL